MPVPLCIGIRFQFFSNPVAGFSSEESQNIQVLPLPWCELGARVEREISVEVVRRDP